MRFSPTALASLLPLLLAAAPAPAQTTQASGPTSAVSRWLHAMDGTEPAEVNAVLLPGNDAEKQVVATLRRLADATALLRQAMFKEFRERAEPLFRRPDRTAGATEQIDGDSATVRLNDGTLLALRRIDGRWRIPVEQVTRGAPTDLPTHLSRLGTLAASIERIAQNVSDGRIHTADEVAQHLQEDVVKAMAEPPPPQPPPPPPPPPAK